MHKGKSKVLFDTLAKKYPRVAVTGFSNALRQIWRDTPHSNRREVISDYGVWAVRDPIGVIPDAYLVGDDGELFVFEVEVSSFLTFKKARIYDWLDGVLDLMNWTLCVVIIDRYGTETEWDPLGLMYTPAFIGAADCEVRA